MRAYVFCIALLTATAAAAQAPKLEVGTRVGDSYWVVETYPDGSRRGGWVGVNVPLDRIDRSAFKALPSGAPPTPTSAPPQESPDAASVNDRLVRIEQALAAGQTSRREPEVVRSAPLPQVSQPRTDSAPPTRSQTREGFWFSGGLGYGSLSCLNCDGYANGFSGGLALGGTINEKLLLGVGTTGWYRSQDGIWLSVGTVDARVRFYPSVRSGFFINGGLGVGTISLGLSGIGSDSETGVGLMLGLGWDVRIARNVSLTPFWNGSAVRTANADASFGQLGLGITVH